MRAHRSRGRSRGHRPVVDAAPTRAGPGGRPGHDRLPVPGDIVMVDGQQVGVTRPLDVAASTHSIRSTARAIAGTRAAGSEHDCRSDAEERAAIVLAAAAARRGRADSADRAVRRAGPEGDKVLGSSADGPVVTTRHHQPISSSTRGYRARQTVEIKAGRSSRLRRRLTAASASTRSPGRRCRRRQNRGRTLLANLRCRSVVNEIASATRSLANIARRLSKAEGPRGSATMGR